MPEREKRNERGGELDETHTAERRRKMQGETQEEQKRMRS